MTTPTAKTTPSKDGPPEAWTLEQMWPFIYATLGIAASSRGKRPASSEGSVVASTAGNACSPADREALDPVPSAVREHPEDLDEVERGQDQIEQPARVLRERETGEPAATNTVVALFEDPRQAPDRPVSQFKGRDDEQVHAQQLVLGDNHTVSVMATSTSGIGKTTLAQEFVATRTRELCPDRTAWLDGKQIIAELGHVSRRCGAAEERAPTPAEALSLLRPALHAKSVLLVIDNFDSEHRNPEHAPSPGQWPTLVMSRARPLAALPAAELELGVWAAEACREYLRARCLRLAKEADTAVGRLAEFVGRLPLGVRLLV